VANEALASLREYLAQAARLTSELTDRSADRTPRGRYLSSDLLETLERVAAHEGRITLIVGAGASIEAGLPSWPRLVRSLLEVAGGSLEAELRRRWTAKIEEEGLLAAAAVVKALCADEDDFRSRLRDALHDGQPMTSYVPQALAEQIAWLKKECGAGVVIATGNYDGLLEQALRDIGLEVKSNIRWRAEPAGAAAVYHLHGRLMPGYPKTGNLILSEDDYAQMQDPGSWQEGFMRDALQNTLCVFVGLSMTDPNLIRWLYRYSGESSGDLAHLALFVRQASPELDDELRLELERATRARWARCGVDAVWADFFGESAQFIHELALRRSGRRTPDFHTRAKERLDAVRFYLAPTDPSAFKARQEEISDLLQAMVGGVQDIALAGGVDLSEESLGLGFWVADHERGTVSCWATADRRLNGVDALVDNFFEYSSPWIAVEAVTRGVPVQQDPAVFASRWRLVRGIPIVVAQQDGSLRTVVGAMTLTSMTPEAESALSLSRAPRGLLGAIDRLLAVPVAQLFRR
jgi:hypothetical protein